jgi:MATE family multidrug resistance protein
MPDDIRWNTSFTMTTPPRAIKSQPSRHGSLARSPFSSSYISASPIAQESIARDLAECSDDEDDAAEPDSPSDSESDSEASTIRQDGRQDAHHSMASSYRRPSFVAFGGTRPAVAGMQHAPAPEANWLTKKEKKQSRNEERSLLRDNHLGEF